MPDVMTQAEVEIEVGATAGALPAPALSGSVAAAPEASTIFQLIERVARDPGVDIEKMDRLLAMQERVLARQAQIAFDGAMRDAQAEMQPVRTDANNPQTHSRYASYGALDGAIRPIYTEHGFALSFNTGDAGRPDDIRVLCTVSHRDGHRQEYRFDMPADGKGAKGGDVMSRTHAAGSAATYGKRYLLGLIFNIAVVRDDDGNAAGARGTAGAGRDFIPERRSQGGGNWEEEARRDGTLDSSRPKGTLPSATRKVITPIAKVKEAVDKRVAFLRSKSVWSRYELDQFWADDHAWIDWMADPNNDVLAEYERFTKAFSDAELKIREVA